MKLEKVELNPTETILHQMMQAKYNNIEFRMDLWCRLFSKTTGQSKKVLESNRKSLANKFGGTRVYGVILEMLSKGCKFPISEKEARGIRQCGHDTLMYLAKRGYVVLNQKRTCQHCFGRGFIYIDPSTP